MPSRLRRHAAAAVVATGVLAATVVAPTGAGAASGWNDGAHEWDNTVNCIGHYTEKLGESWVGWFGEIGNKPRVDEVYYVRAWWFVSGNPCGGGAYVHLELALPAHTQLAITKQTPVRCFYWGPGKGSFSEFTQDCPQTPGSSYYGGPSFNPPGGSSWPTASGAAFQIWVPVKTSKPLSGMLPSEGQVCESCLYAGIWMIDGVDSPWLVPRVPIRVEGTGSSSGPQVGYPVPSVRENQYNASTGKSSAQTWGTVYTEGTSGTGWFDFGPTKDYGQRDQGPLTNGTWYVWSEWANLVPGKTYHFRACYRPTGGTAVCGADQAFKAAAGPDTTAPNTSIKSGPKGFVASVKAHFRFGSNEDGVAFLCSLDGAAFAICPAGKPTYSGLSQGKHTLRVKAKDAAGNEDPTPAGRGWTVDTVPPNTKITGGPSGTVKAKKATFKFTSTEAKSGFLCSLDGGRFKACTSPTSYTGLGRGRHTFAVRAKDRAGNLDPTPAKRSWRIA